MRCSPPAGRRSPGGAPVPPRRSEAAAQTCSYRAVWNTQHNNVLIPRCLKYTQQQRAHTALSETHRQQQRAHAALIETHGQQQRAHAALIEAHRQQQQR